MTTDIFVEGAHLNQGNLKHSKDNDTKNQP